MVMYTEKLAILCYGTYTETKKCDNAARNESFVWRVENDNTQWSFASYG